MVSDELKLNSDDSFLTTDHIKFLLQKYRTFLLYQRYKDVKKELSEANYQEICLSLEEVDSLGDIPCVNSKYLRSVEKIPTLMTIGNPHVYPSSDFYSGTITFVSRERMRFVGHNKLLKNIIYCSLSPDGHLYFKSQNPQFMYLSQVVFAGVFENPEQANQLKCEKAEEEGACDIMDKEFPIEEDMVPMLIECVVKELLGVNYRPLDEHNNARDENSSIGSAAQQAIARRPTTNIEQ